MPELDELFLLGLLNFAKANDIEMQISTITHPEWSLGIKIEMSDRQYRVARIIPTQDLLLSQNYVVMDPCNWMLDELMAVKAEYEKGN